ncbi:Fe(3+) ABC transporter substrate-binding protein [Parvibaculum sp.]|jgi:iron(III) transport system substrate-binding protein|uniref:Fe(3+) ABC transporter substrate-binding protein n=1 Tax=Parvibaculum sp. TaxID=2024848 RepID=UPI000EB8EC51|nr:Fe(3+) ABC transporter substrate-binding protein [Parvibaculum sp.]MBO6666492.1 Fe(3+) ABC transporter substrate-binding protein [Parvibaculum sp.]MBO6690913.1 Fe(3+) ABC transporter substrate-binding protein [Parvibaculum sp.]MBO6713113.1 Fe(3+) ABC transporter substrate-binding protein [Parvibaculum sp.]HAC59839.1 Fe(3+) ABC transporter substrate-binding protein [Rhodobiaceae bacterium]
MFRFFAAALVLASGIAAVVGAKAETQEVNIYSARHYDTDLKLYDRFTEETGIRVNLIEGGSDELIARIEREGKQSPADILVTVDAGRLWRAEEKGLFSPVKSEVLETRIPAHLRHPDGLWFGLSKRARIIIYNKAMGRPEKLETYDDLADPSHKGEICMRSSSNIYNISLLASLIEHEGQKTAENWAKGVVANLARPPQGNDTSNIEAVAAGECRISLVNTYYVGRMLASDKADDVAAAEKVGLIFPNQDDRGTHVNISGAGVLKYAPNRENAIKFMEFLTSDWAQNLFTESNHEYTAVPGAMKTSPVKGTGSFKEDEINASALGENQAEAVRIFDRAGWQ